MRKLLLSIYFMVSITLLGQAQITSTGRVTETVIEPMKIDATNVTVADDNLTGAPGNTASVYSNVQNISSPPATFGGNYDTMTNYSAFMNPTVGGTFSATSKRTFSGFAGQLAGATKGQHLLYFGSVQSYGFGDAEWGMGDVRCWGGGYVAGTSSPTCNAVGEFGAQDGNLVFTSLINGNPAASATVITYDTDVNESVIGARFLLNLTRITTAGTVASVSGTTVTTSSSPNWTAAAAVCNGQSAGVACDPTGQYWKITSDDVSIGGVSTGHWFKITAVINTTSFTIENSYDTTALAASGSYVVSQGIMIESFDKTANTLTIDANSYDWADNDVLHSPPNHQNSLRGLYFVLDHKFKTGGPTIDGSAYATVLNGNPIDNMMNFSGTGGARTGINFNTPCTQTCISVGSATGSGVGMFFVGTNKMLGRNGGGGGTGVGFGATDTMNWATGASDSVLSIDATTKAPMFSVAGATAYRVPLTVTSTAALNFANQVAVGCEVLTIAVTGAVDGDSVSLGIPNASNVTNSVFYAWVSAADTVSVKHCSVVSGDPASGTFRATVFKF